MIVLCSILNGIFAFSFIPYDIINFVILSSMLIVTNLIESFACFLLVKIIPSEWTLCGLNSGMLITLANTLARIFGASLLTISLFAGGEENFILINFGFTFSLLIILTIFIICNFSELRVKALSRIMKSSLT
jgi:hypothetical protein